MIMIYYAHTKELLKRSVITTNQPCPTGMKEGIQPTSGSRSIAARPSAFAPHINFLLGGGHLGNSDRSSSRSLGLAGAQGGEGNVGRLLARDEHGAEGRAHAWRGVLRAEQSIRTWIRRFRT